MRFDENYNLCLTLLNRNACKSQLCSVEMSEMSLLFCRKTAMETQLLRRFFLQEIPAMVHHLITWVMHQFNLFSCNNHDNDNNDDYSSSHIFNSLHVHFQPVCNLSWPSMSVLCSSFFSLWHALKVLSSVVILYGSILILHILHGTEC